MGHTTAVAATALGAKVIEKHFCRRRSDGGQDAGFSMEPEEFAALVRAVREAEAAIGTVSYGTGLAEAGNLVFRRSVVAVADIVAGHPLTEENIRVIRPGHGLEPKYLPLVLGRVASKNITRGTPLSWDLIGAPHE